MTTKNEGGVWALLGMTGGLNLLCRFVNTSAEEVDECITSGKGWIAVNQAYSLMAMPGQSPRGPVLVPMCAPYGMTIGETQMVSIQIPNIIAVMLFDDMDRNSRSEMEQHIKNARELASRMRAQSSGITLAK